MDCGGRQASGLVYCFISFFDFGDDARLVSFGITVRSRPTLGLFLLSLSSFRFHVLTDRFENGGLTGFTGVRWLSLGFAGFHGLSAGVLSFGSTGPCLVFKSTEQLSFILV